MARCGSDGESFRLAGQHTDRASCAGQAPDRRKSHATVPVEDEGIESVGHAVPSHQGADHRDAKSSSHTRPLVPTSLLLQLIAGEHPVAETQACRGQQPGGRRCVRSRSDPATWPHSSKRARSRAPVLRQTSTRLRALPVISSPRPRGLESVPVSEALGEPPPDVHTGPPCTESGSWVTGAAE